MKVLVVYDSVHGNTALIARAVGSALASDVKVAAVGEITPSLIEAPDLLVVGSPTHGGKATPAILEFISGIPGTTIKNLKAAAFDTRLTTRWVAIFGYAAGQISGSLKTRGATLVAAPEAFFVKGTEGPLKEGELERAKGWAITLLRTKAPN